jgi:hypothetical protein
MDNKLFINSDGGHSAPTVATNAAHTNTTAGDVDGYGVVVSVVVIAAASAKAPALPSHGVLAPYDPS